MSIKVANSKTAYSLDGERQCRALGHVFERDFRLSTGVFEVQQSNDCFRCGQRKVESVEDAA